MVYSVNLDADPADGNRAAEFIRNVVIPCNLSSSHGLLGAMPDTQVAQYPEFAIAISWAQRRYRLLYEAIPLDGGHIQLRINLALGWVPHGRRKAVERVGLLLKSTAYHVVIDDQLIEHGELSIRQELVFRDADLDEADCNLLCRAVVNILKLAFQLNWFFVLRIPKWVSPYAMNRFEVSHRSLPQKSLKGFVESRMNYSGVFDYRCTMVWSATAIGEWELVLKLLSDYEELIPRRGFIRLRIYCLVQLKRFAEAVRVAEANGISNGEFPKCPCMSGSYLQALIYSGDSEKAARLLGETKEGEPDFYKWLRGLAHAHSGDGQKASEYYAEYFKIWPGDVLGLNKLKLKFV